MAMTKPFEVKVTRKPQPPPFTCRLCLKEVEHWQGALPKGLKLCFRCSVEEGSSREFGYLKWIDAGCSKDAMLLATAASMIRRLEKTGGRIKI